MYKYIWLLFLCLLLISSSCKTDKINLNKTLVKIDSFPVVDSIILKPISEYNHGIPGSIQIADTTLIILHSNKNTEFFLHNFNTNNYEVSEGYLKKGRGPNEALGAWLTGIHNEKLWIFDITTRKIFTILVNQALSSLPNKEIIEYKLDKQHIRLDFLDSCNVLAVGNEETYAKMQNINILTGVTTNEIGEFEIPSNNNVPFEALKDAYTSYIYIRPSGGKVVLPYRYTDVIEIYDLKNQSSKAIWGPECFDVQFESGRNSFGFFMSKTKETQKAFVHGTVTDNFIYLIYSGHERDDPNWSKGRYLYVYDWDGNPIKKYVMDRHIIAFDVSDNDSQLYAYDGSSGFIVHSYLLN